MQYFKIFSFSIIVLNNVNIQKINGSNTSYRKKYLFLKQNLGEALRR